MRITHLQLSNFRSYADAAVEFGAGVTTLQGSNGRGKTNVVEAVRYLSTLGSHRVATDAPLIMAGQDRAVVAGRVERGDRALTLELTIVSGKANQARINRSPSKPRDVVGILRTVLFAPEDLALVKGDPSARRAFLDELVVAIQPTLAGDMADYERVIRQRSALLKSARGKPRVDAAALTFWDESLARHGARIMDARLRAVARLAPLAAAAYGEVAPGEGDLELGYESATEHAAGDDATTLQGRLLERMAQLLPSEIDRGVCLVGPHRDDLAIHLRGLPAKGYASHGESWSAALALRLGSFDLLKDDGTDGEPVLILDDVFAELDVRRREALAGRIASAGQVIITAAVAADVPPQLREHPAGHVVLDVHPGAVVPHE